MCITGTKCLQNLEEGVGSPWNGVTDGFEQPCRCWKSNPGPPQEQHVFVATGPSFQRPLDCVCCCYWRAVLIVAVCWAPAVLGSLCNLLSFHNSPERMHAIKHHSSVHLLTLHTAGLIRIKQRGLILTTCRVLKSTLQDLDQNGL